MHLSSISLIQRYRTTHNISDFNQQHFYFLEVFKVMVYLTITDILDAMKYSTSQILLKLSNSSSYNNFNRENETI